VDLALLVHSQYSQASRRFDTDDHNGLDQRITVSEQADAWRGRVLVIFDGLGHVLHEENPAQILAAVQAFLRRFSA